MSRYIRLSDELIGTPVFKNQTTFKVFAWLLMRTKKRKEVVVMRKGKGFMEVTVTRGQLLYCRSICEKDTDVPGSTLERHIKSLADQKLIAVHKTTNYTIISVKEFYQYTFTEEKPKKSKRRLPVQKAPKNEQLIPEPEEIQQPEILPLPVQPSEQVIKPDPHIPPVTKPVLPVQSDGKTKPFSFDEALALTNKSYEEHTEAFRKMWTPGWFDSYKKYTQFLIDDFPNIQSNEYHLGILDYYTFSKLMKQTHGNKFNMKVLHAALTKLSALGVQKNALLRLRLADFVDYVINPGRGPKTPVAETVYKRTSNTIDHSKLK